MNREELEKFIADSDEQIQALEKNLETLKEKRKQIEKKAIGQSRKDKLKDSSRKIQSTEGKIREIKRKKEAAQNKLVELVEQQEAMTSSSSVPTPVMEPVVEEEEPRKAKSKTSTDLRNEAEALLNDAVAIIDEHPLAGEAAFDVAVQTEEEAYRMEQEALPLIEIFTDENGVKYIKASAMEALGIEKPTTSYSLNGLDGDFYQLTDFQIDAIKNNANFRNVTKTIHSSDVVSNEAAIEEEASIETSSDDGETTDVQVDEEDTNTTTVTPPSEPAAPAAPAAVEETEESVFTSADMEYKTLLERRIRGVENKLAILRRKEARDITGRTGNAIKGFEIELERLKEEIANLDRPELGVVGEVGLAVMDDKREKNSGKQSKYREQIEQLQAAKAQLEMVRSKRLVDKRIERINKKIKKLQKADVFYGKVQRTIMYPKFVVEAKKRNMLAHAEGRVHAYESRIRDNEKLNDELSAIFKDNMFNDIRERFYDLKGAYYQKRLERSRAILEAMQQKDSIITMVGARVTSLPKKYVDKIRQNNEEQMQMETAGMTA